MSDPVAEVVSLLQPSATTTKLVDAAGSWIVRRDEVGRAFYCAVVKGSFRLTVPGLEPLILAEGDFVLIPSAQRFETSSLDRDPADRDETTPVEVEPGVVRLGRLEGEAEVRHLVGYGLFKSDDANLLVSLLPPLIHVPGERGLTMLAQLIDREVRSRRPGREVVLTRLLEVLLIEALRSTPGPTASPGLLRGLADPRLAAALRLMHEGPTEAWTVARLARETGLSRSVFFERFRRELGLAPMQYLLGWRMTLAKAQLRGGTAVSEVAKGSGYGSASAFSTAFARYTGLPPAVYARARAES